MGRNGLHLMMGGLAAIGSGLPPGLSPPSQGDSGAAPSASLPPHWHVVNHVSYRPDVSGFVFSAKVIFHYLIHYMPITLCHLPFVCIPLSFFLCPHLRRAFSSPEFTDGGFCPSLWVPLPFLLLQNLSPPFCSYSKREQSRTHASTVFRGGLANDCIQVLSCEQFGFVLVWIRRVLTRFMCTVAGSVSVFQSH